MKRDKITFVFFLIPIFFFSGSLKYFSFDKGKNPNSSLTQQQIKSIKEGLPFHSKRSHHVQDQALVNSKTTLPEKPREATRSTYQPRKIKRIPPARSRDFLFNRAKRPNPSRFRQQIKYLNKGQPFRYKGSPYVPNEVLVKFKPTISEQMIDATIEAYQSRKLKRIPRIGIYQIQIPDGTTVKEMLFLLRRNPYVEHAEPNYIAYIAVTPNDEFFWRQYALSNPGGVLPIPEDPEGTQGADIKATAAWEETKGDEKVIIAVIDSGVDYNHEDLNANMWTNSGEIPDNGEDDDGNGYVDDYYGINVITGSGDPMDDHGHGTHVAGIAAAETNNREGIAGVAWNCKILPVKVINDQGEGTYFQVIQGIDWAADNGADVINISLGGDSESTFLEDALKDAYDKNIVIVAAAGNEGAAVLYPAAYDDYCLAVAATNYNDERVTFANSSEIDLEKWESNYGPEVDVAAPGQWIMSLVPSWYPGQVPPWEPDDLPYGFGRGTSVATPHVAGLAALIKSIKPWLTNAQIMNVIRYTAEDINSADYPGKDDFVGYGRINMEKALVPIEIKSSK